MQPSQKLTRALRALVELVEEEASKNPDFATRLEGIVAELPAESPNKKASKPKNVGVVVPIPDVLKLFQEKGESEFRFCLREFDLPILKAIVKANGFDPGKNSQRWTEPDKFISLIAEQTDARLRRGSSFLPPKADQTDSPTS